MKIEIPLYDIKIKFYFDYDLKKPINTIKKKHNKKKLYKINKIDFDGIVIGEFIPKNKLIYMLIKKTKNGVKNSRYISNERRKIKKMYNIQQPK